MSTDSVSIALAYLAALSQREPNDPATVAAELRRLAQELSPCNVCAAVASISDDPEEAIAAAMYGDPTPDLRCNRGHAHRQSECTEVCAPTPDPDDSAAWKLPRAGMEWRYKQSLGWFIAEPHASGWVGLAFLAEDGAVDGALGRRWDPDAPAIEAVLRAREAARRAKEAT